jgi:hypothetical protein
MGLRELTLAGLAVAAPLSGASAQTLGVNPGQWAVKVTVTALDMPSAPPGAVDALKGRSTNVNQCITPEIAARGPKEMFKQNGDCTFARYSFENGKLSAQMKCTQGENVGTVTIDGTFAPDSFTSTSQTVSTGPMAMTMTATMSGHRVGDCAK